MYFYNFLLFIFQERENNIFTTINMSPVLKCSQECFLLVIKTSNCLVLSE